MVIALTDSALRRRGGCGVGLAGAQRTDHPPQIRSIYGCTLRPDLCGSVAVSECMSTVPERRRLGKPKFAELPEIAHQKFHSWNSGITLVAERVAAQADTRAAPNSAKFVQELLVCRQRLLRLGRFHRGDTVLDRLLHFLEGAHLDLTHPLA